MKTHRFFSVFLLLILAVSLLTGPASAAEVPDPAIQAKAALLVDANTGRMVYGKNEHEELYPASLTKIMTALLTLEAVDSGQLSMDQPITVTESALEGLAADGSTAGIRAGEVLSPEFKEAGRPVYLFRPEDFRDYGALSALWAKFHGLCLDGTVKAAWAVGPGGAAEAVMKMSFGNRIGFQPLRDLQVLLRRGIAFKIPV